MIKKNKMINLNIIENNYRTITNSLTKNTSSSAVSLLGVSKGQSVEKIRELIALGLLKFGENKVQEAAKKWISLKKEYPSLSLHLIGALQTNKAEDAVELFDVIEIVDRGKLVDALVKAEHKLNIKREYYLQINIGKEEQKAGVAIERFSELKSYAEKAGLRVTGIMCIPPEGMSPAPYFALTHKIAKAEGLKNISMGMSSDYILAASLGSTQVRIGTQLFGERDYSSI
jgi:pyridoxal phosphate enzyme (YggS family)